MQSAMHTDAERIQRLIFTYAERLDQGDLAGVAALFASATFRSDRRPEARTGSEEVLEMFRRTVALYDGRPSTKHVTTNVIVDLEGESASARSYFTVLQARPELPLQPIIAGRYHDRFRRRDGAWQFSDRLVIVDLVGDLRFHLAANVI